MRPREADVGGHDVFIGDEAVHDAMNIGEQS